MRGRTRNAIFSLLIFFWTAILICFTCHSLYIQLPNIEDDRILFFKENGKDLKYILSSSLKSATESIFVSSFGMNDKDIVKILQTQSTHIPIKIFYDSKENNILPRGELVSVFPYKKQGLMHRKLIAIDKELLFLGSTNLTPLALKIHKNLIVCIRSKELYLSIVENLPLVKNSYSFFPLPHSTNLAIKALLNEIDNAKNRIYVCMYAFTHEELAHALIRAHSRGVSVKVFIDRGMANGTCKKLKALLKQYNIPTFTNLGSGLLHHKCALIDNTFTFGSANWTMAAFHKNEEHLFFFNDLSKKELSEITKFFSHIERSSKKTTG